MSKSLEVSLPELVIHVKKLVVAWEGGGGKKAMELARSCGCGCPVRHGHGGYPRYVVVGSETFRVWIPRLHCLVCGKTEAILPEFLGPRSPYPWCVQQAAMVEYLAGTRGYRPVAAEFVCSWQLLWRWVDVLARKAKSLLAKLTELLFDYQHSGGGTPRRGFLDGAVLELAHYWPKARTPAKRENLAAIGPLFETANAFWQKGFSLGISSWGQPDPSNLLSFLAACQKALY